MIDQREFKRLVAFKTVYELKSFSKASEFLLKTQPAISTLIKQLEGQLNVELFERQSKKQVTATDAAHLLYKKVVAILEMWNEAIYSINSLSNQNKLCRMSASTSTSPTLLPQLISSLRAFNDDVDYTLHSQLSEDIYQDVINRKLDLGLVEIDVPESHSLNIIPLYQDPLVLAGDFDSKIWILNTTRTSINMMNEIYLDEFNITPQNFVRVDSNAALLDLLMEGVGCSLVSLETIKDTDIPYKKIPEKYFRTFSLLVPNPPTIIYDEIEEGINSWVKSKQEGNSKT